MTRDTPNYPSAHTAAWGPHDRPLRNFARTGTTDDARKLFRQAVKIGDVHVVILRGELDMDSAQGPSDWLVEIAGSPVVLDMSELTFMDSSGIKPSSWPKGALRKEATT